MFGGTLRCSLAYSVFHPSFNPHYQEIWLCCLTVQIAHMVPLERRRSSNSPVSWWSLLGVPCTVQAAQWGVSVSAPDVVVLPTRYVQAWDGSSGGSRFTARNSVVALNEAYDTDAHFLCYAVPGEEAWPRLRLDQASKLDDLGSEPVMVLAAVDFDLPEHRPWADRDECEEAFAALRGMWPEAGVYTTAHGMRVLWNLAEPVPVSVWRSWYEQFLRDYVKLPADESCADWTRLFRCPRTRREDGASHEALVDLAPLDTESLPWSPSQPLTRTVTRSLDVEMPAPEPLEDDHPAWTQVRPHTAAGERLDDLRAGSLVMDVGERHKSWVRLAASLMSQIRPVDAVVVFRMLAPSALMDTREGATQIGKLWDIVTNRAATELETSVIEGWDRPQANVHRRDQPIIVNVARNFYVRKPEGGYSFALNGTNLAAEVRRLQPGLNIYTQQGAPHPPARILANFGRVAEAVIYDSNEPEGKFYADTCKLHVPGSVQKVVPPEYSAEVEDWLRHFADAQESTLLDWLATFRDLSSPTAALYLQGPRGAGKGMLASALAQFWGSSATAFRTATARFNWRLKDMPFVHLDEGIAMTAEMSSRFRSMVSEVVHEIEGKNLPHATLLGALRVLITANNAHAIELHGVYSAEDMRAIAARILHMEIPQEARGYLRFMGGRSYTHDWVVDASGQPGKICRHVAWLQENRVVERGSRFAVEGQWSRYHTGLITSSNINSQILIAVAYAIAPVGPGGGLSVPDGIVAHQGHAWVNATILHKHWRDLLPHEDKIKPTSAVVTKALKAIAADRTSRMKAFRTRKLRYWRLDGDMVVRTAEEQGYPGVDDLIEAFRC